MHLPSGATSLHKKVIIDQKGLIYEPRISMRGFFFEIRSHSGLQRW